jgi:urease accessory protein
MMKKAIFSLIALMGFPIAALAHPGHETVSFMSGFLHPLTGIDHLLVMLAVGFWTGRSVGPLRWQVPGLFLTFVLVGLLFGAMLKRPPYIELAITLSVLSMGLVILLSARINPLWQLGLAIGFALMHGFVHGQELLLADGGGWAIMGTFITTTMLLTVGLYLGNYKDRVGAYLQHAMISALTLGGAYLLLT